MSIITMDVFGDESVIPSRDGLTPEARTTFDEIDKMTQKRRSYGEENFIDNQR